MSPAAPLPPPAPVFLKAAWRDLVLLTYEVDPAVLGPRLPFGTELDLWDGRALASLVGFRFVNTRVKGLPIPFHRHFLELNLRFYVRRETSTGLRRGVVFVKEIVPRRLIAWVARTLYEEPYVALPMRADVAVPVPGVRSAGHVRYAAHVAGRWHTLGADVQGAPEFADPNSEAAFITEHYWGYTRRRDGSTSEYEVEHPRWRLWTATAITLDLNASALYGAEFAASLGGAPRSAFVAEGSDVVVRAGRRLERGSACT